MGPTDTMARALTLALALLALASPPLARATPEQDVRAANYAESVRAAESTRLAAMAEEVLGRISPAAAAAAASWASDLPQRGMDDASAERQGTAALELSAEDVAESQAQRFSAARAQQAIRRGRARSAVRQQQRREGQQLLLSRAGGEPKDSKSKGGSKDKPKEDKKKEGSGSTRDHIVGVSAADGKECPASQQKSMLTALLLLCLAGGPPAERIYLGYYTLGGVGCGLLLAACMVPLFTCVSWMRSTPDEPFKSGAEPLMEERKWSRPCVPRECFWPSVCLYICGIFLVTLLLCWLVFDLFQLLTEGLLDANGCRLAD